jgi:hypothetical protein
MSTPTDIGLADFTSELAQVEALMMARLDKIEREQEAEVAKREALRAALDDLLGEMGQMCSYLASVAERLKANS